MNKNIEDNSERGISQYFKKVKKPGKNLFWAWIAYQAVKGTLTTSLIWVPLIYYWWTH
tara:strand:+ start:884 stop:1057 length:174 start_codon:yes stop_codon:yes gene_type:complete